MNPNHTKPLMISLDIGDQLTTISCGHVVVELIKFIAYQRLQIPFTYQWLKQVVTKKRMCENKDMKDSFQSERYFHTASTALDNLDFMLKSLLQEIGSLSIPDEVCIAFGPTPVTCKEVYRLLLPTACHKPQCQSSWIATDQKIQRNVFKTLVTSETLNQVFFNTLPPTNMYVFIKKKMIGNQDGIINRDNYTLTSGCRIPRKSKIVVLDFRTFNHENVACCNDFQIFGDVISDDLVNLQLKEDNCDYDNEFYEIESTDCFKWYRSCYVMKGFKDCIVNGSSVTNLWLQ